MKKTFTVKVGDRVAYAWKFLASIGMSHTFMAKARGTVTAVEDFGSNQLVTIEWNDEDVPARVIAANLAKVGANTRFANCGV
jgi:hypothetical protein